MGVGNKVIVGMSGGVDSSVAAALLLEQGYQVEGLFMKNWEEDDGTEFCTAVKDYADAQSVCERLGIKLHMANFASEYWDGVFAYFLQEYQAGRTPNPDVLCNREIKFKAFLDYAMQLGADYIATGHYARILREHGQTLLLRGVDDNKDQSYFLHAVKQEQLAKVLFPVGELQKPQVRQIAEKLGLSTANKKDSTGICFIGERRFNAFIAEYLPAQPGAMIDDQGRYLGEHNGLMFYTLGQRGGIGLGGVKGVAEGAWYVLAKDVTNNRLIVGQGHDHPYLQCNTLYSSDISWVGQPLAMDLLTGAGLACTAKIRYRQADQACSLVLVNGQWQVRFAQAQRAATPGQSVVFYQGDVCLGGGVINTIDAAVPASILAADWDILSALSKTRQRKLNNKYGV